MFPRWIADPDDPYGVATLRKVLVTAGFAILVIGLLRGLVRDPGGGDEQPPGGESISVAHDRGASRVEYASVVSIEHVSSIQYGPNRQHNGSHSLCRMGESHTFVVVS
jgi:hypothetical protein